jgi:pyrroline-5-carboxylate reductase
MTKIGVIGTGFMGTAVMKGILRQNRDVEFGIIEKDAPRRDYCARELGARDFSARPAELFDFSELVVLAIKPQDLDTLAETVGTAAKNSLVLSMLAGTPMAKVGKQLGTERLIRIMPNLAADIGKAVTGVTFSPFLDATTRKDILTLLAGIGTLLEVREDQLNAITGVSGSGIAYVFRFIDALAMGGVEQGLPYGQALEAARDVVESAALLLRETKTLPAELVGRVCSPGGTTIRGIRALEEGKFNATVMAAVEAATARSRELER